MKEKEVEAQEEGNQEKVKLEDVEQDEPFIEVGSGKIKLGVWADAFYKLKCPSVYPSNCLSVC